MGGSVAFRGVISIVCGRETEDEGLGVVGDGGGAGGGERERGTNALMGHQTTTQTRGGKKDVEYARDQGKQQRALPLMPAQLWRLLGRTRYDRYIL